MLIYYTRQQIEQVFDIGKNYAEMIPLKVQNEDNFRGHLLLTFIATVIKLIGLEYKQIAVIVNYRNTINNVAIIMFDGMIQRINDLLDVFKNEEASGKVVDEIVLNDIPL